MNRKTTVTKELDAKHTKILEGLLKLPENRECADCKTRAPRWASVNLGIFICIQCSGIHRSIGVHISKVRSTMLDMWLPEQIAFMKTMGNGKSNAYWEAELPPNYSRVGTENFIRAKYIEKKWILRNEKQRALTKIDVHLDHEPRPGSCDGLKNARVKPNLYRERKSSNSPSMEDKRIIALPSLSLPRSDSRKDIGTGNRTSKPPPVSTQAGPNNKEIIVHRSESEVNKGAKSIHISHPQKVDYAAQLLRVFSMDDSKSLEVSITDKWVDFYSDDALAAPKETTLLKPSESKIHPEVKTGNFPPKIGHVSAATSINGPSKNSVQSSMEVAINANSVNNQVDSRFTSAARPQPHFGFQTQRANMQRDQFDGTVVPSTNGPGIIKQDRIHSTQMPKNMQMQNLQPPYFTGNNVASYRTTSVSNHGTTTLVNGRATGQLSSPGGASWRARPMLPVSGHDYDFSSLTQQLLTKR